MLTSWTQSALLLRLTILSVLINSTWTAGYIDLHIRQILLTRAPSGCCPNAIDCPSAMRPPSCALNLALCIDVAESPSTSHPNGSCRILAQNFALNATNIPAPFDAANRTFATSQLGPPIRFNFTSAAIAKTISIEIKVRGGAADDQRVLLFSREQTSLHPHSLFPHTFKYEQHANSLTYQIRVHCAPGFFGPDCGRYCDPPKDRDNYVCGPEGIRCLPGWTGPQCSRPVCSQQCANGGRCVAPGQCECQRGWAGLDCRKCVPRASCQNGYCTSEPGKCYCLPNWTGAECDLAVDKCLERPCFNGGKCTTGGGHGHIFHCECPAGFTGVDCSISFAVCKRARCAPDQHCVPLANNTYTCAENTAPSSREELPSLQTSPENFTLHPTAAIHQEQSWNSDFVMVKSLAVAILLLLCLMLAIILCSGVAPSAYLFDCRREQPVGRVPIGSVDESECSSSATVRSSLEFGASKKWRSDSYPPAESPVPTPPPTYEEAVFRGGPAGGTVAQPWTRSANFGVTTTNEVGFAASRETFV